MVKAEPTQRLSRWLKKFDKALRAEDIEAAAGLFHKDCYWRDLIAFTWNIKTLEGRPAIEAMLRARLAETKPLDWAIEGEATEAGEVTEGWLVFETARARCSGHIRLKGDKCWTLLTSMNELKGFEEKRGATREKGVQHGVVKGRESWAERKAREEAELGVTRQPYCLIVGGGQGGVALGARLKRLGVPTIIIDKHERPGDQWRKRYKSLCLHDPVWYDHLALSAVPRSLAGLRAQGQDRRLAGNVRQGHGARLLGLDRMQEREIRREEKGLDGRRRTRRQDR